MKRYGSGMLALVLLAAMLLTCLPALAQSRQAVVTARSATVYEKPKTSSRVLGALEKGATVTVTAVRGQVAQIQYAGGSGYVKKSALKLTQAEKAAATPAPAAPSPSVKSASASATVKKTLRKTTAYLKPSASCKDKTSVRKGTSFVILGSKGEFYQVQRSGQVAYVPKTAFQTVQATPTPAPTPTPSPQTQSRTVKSDSKLYRRASRSARVLAKVEAGDTVQVAQEGKRFAQVYYQGTPGYLPMSAFKEQAAEASPTPAPTATPAPARADSVDTAKADKVVAAALAQLGKPYVYGSTGMSSFDCSGLTRYAYGLVGVTLPHSAYSVGYSSGKKVTRSQLQRGDIVCFNTSSDGDLSDHVGVYMGGGQFVHASSGQGRVVVSSLSGYYSENFSWGRRVL